RTATPASGGCCMSIFPASNGVPSVRPRWARTPGLAEMMPTTTKSPTAVLNAVVRIGPSILPFAFQETGPLYQILNTVKRKQYASTILRRGCGSPRGSHLQQACCVLTENQLGFAARYAGDRFDVPHG